MVDTFNDYKDKSRSEKITLCHVEPFQRLLIWTLDTGAIYKRVTDYFVVDVLNGLTSLTEGTSPTLNAGEWYYEPTTSTCYVRMSDDSNPNTQDLIGKYRLFFANSPLNLPYDLDSGTDVEYLGSLRNNSPVSKELDDEQIGIALESSSSLTFENNDGFFDETYDTLFFENKDVRVYAWSQSIPLSEKKLLFSGQIQDKRYTPDTVTLMCKDFMYKLREPLSMELFTTSDGDISENDLSTPKRRLYGQADGFQCIGIDKTLDGFAVTGTMSGSLDGSTITGVGTSFLDELSPNDELVLFQGNDEFNFSIDSVDSDTSLTISDNLEASFSGASLTCRPTRPWRKKNRNWHVTGHKLREPTTTISVFNQLNRIEVADGTDFKDNDLIDIEGEDVFIKQIVGNRITLESNLQLGQGVSDTVTKNPISRAFIGKNEIFINRDWTLTNTTEAILNIDNMAEFNVARQRASVGTYTFTNGSRTVTATGVDLQNQLQTRDWIRTDDITNVAWYEVLSVEESELTLRTAFTGANYTGDAKKKNVELINDDFTVTVNCIGKETAGVWMKTASDAVKDMLENDAGLSSLNLSTFSKSKDDAPYVLSLALPPSPSGVAPRIRDVVSKINQSVFGSLVNNTDWELVYDVLSPTKPEDLTAIKDDDILGKITVQSKNETVSQVNGSYRFGVDRFTSEDKNKVIEFENDFAVKYTGARQQFDIDLYLYDDNAATEISQRYALFKSLSQSNVTVKTSLNLILKNLNDKMYLELDRLYKRFGNVLENNDRRKIGIINKIVKTGTGTTVEFNDLGNIFNRVMSIAPDTANDFTSADDDEKIKDGYIVDDDLCVPDVTSDAELGTQIIG